MPQRNADTFRKTVQLAEMLEVKVIVGFPAVRVEPARHPTELDHLPLAPGIQ